MSGVLRRHFPTIFLFLIAVVEAHTIHTQDGTIDTLTKGLVDVDASRKTCSDVLMSYEQTYERTLPKLAECYKKLAPYTTEPFCPCPPKTPRDYFP